MITYVLTAERLVKSLSHLQMTNRNARNVAVGTSRNCCQPTQPCPAHILPGCQDLVIHPVVGVHPQVLVVLVLVAVAEKPGSDGGSTTGQETSILPIYTKEHSVPHPLLV